MRFSAKHSAAVYSPRPGDSPAELFAARAATCRSCLHRSAHTCTLAGQLVTVLARDPATGCPAREWADSPHPEATDAALMDVADQPTPAVRAILLKERPAVSVAIITHNYGRFLRESIESVLAQTLLPAELLIVDDASRDETEEIAQTLIAKHRTAMRIRYVRGQWGHASGARRLAYELSTSPLIVFLDGDDKLGPDYLAQGVRLFEGSDVGLVTSDLERFGDARGKIHHAAKNIEQQNFAHSGSIVRRAALDSVPTAELFPEGMKLTEHHDWHCWRGLARAGWRVAHSPGMYHYRQHGASQTDAMRSRRAEYFDLAALRYQPITLFIPLSGRREKLLSLGVFLDRQTWPRDRMRVVIADTSQRPEFGREVRELFSMLDYPDLRIYSQAVARPKIADDDRFNDFVRSEVRRAMPRIYNRALRECSTEYLWILEDDVTPPDDVAERLMRGMAPDVASVSAAYRSRYHDHWHAWTHAGESYSPFLAPPARQLMPVGGNGFGCVMLRQSVARRHVFQCESPTSDYDPNFYFWLASTPFRALVDWRVECHHG
ncbi:MAG: glycosyltransferase [Planctomycetota bacterium]|nr:glycosyltransferase [Planctomycetota bacterium]